MGPWKNVISPISTNALGNAIGSIGWRSAVVAFWLGGSLHPAADPGVARENLSGRNYSVRISIARQTQKVAIKAMGDYRVLNSQDKVVHVLKRDDVHFVEAAPNFKEGKIYRLVFKELGSHENDNAIVLAKAAEQTYELPTKIVRLPARKPEEKDKLLVVVGEFASMDEARAFRDKTKSETIRRIYEENTTGHAGGVILRDAAGKVEASDESRLRIVPDDLEGNSLYLQKTQTGRSAASNAPEKGRHYRGEIELSLDEKGTLAAVNDLWIEYYLYGVVAAEMGDFAPLEALKAQAVVSRSEAVAKIEQGMASKNRLFDFVDSSIAQSYSGVGRENDQVRRAVDATRGEILVWEGKPADAVYSHSCGGIVAAAGDTWVGGTPGYSHRMIDRLGNERVPDLSDSTQAEKWITGSVDSFCNPNQAGFPEYAKKHWRWTVSYTNDQLTSLLNKGYGTGKIQDVAVERRSESGRVRSVLVVGEKRTIRLDREMDIRSALGDLQSTFFVLNRHYDASHKIDYLKISGAGFGHGVGMCQMGAFMMAKQNYTYRQILGHYFADVKMRRLYG